MRVAAGNFVETINAEARATDSISESLPALVARLARTPAPRDVVTELLAEGEIAVVFGEPRVSKTWMTLDLAIAVATGTPALGCDRWQVPTPGAVLYISNEDAPRRLAARCRGLLTGRGLDTLPAGIRFIVGQGVSLDDVKWQRRVIDDVRSHDVRMVAIDPARSVSACVDQGPHELRPFGVYLRRLIAETGAGVLVVHHETKPQAGVTDTRRRANRISGGGMFSIADRPIHAERIDDTHTLLTPSGFKHAADPDPVTLERRHLGESVQFITHAPTAATSADVSLHARILDYLRNSPGATGNRVAFGVRSRKDSVLGALETLSAADKVDAVRAKRGTQWFIREAVS